MLTSYLICIGVVSIITMILFALDKIKSKSKRAVRIPESVLLTFIALGGAIGGLVGMYVFRHKSDFGEKFQFGIGLWFSLVCQLAIGVFLLLVKLGSVPFAQ